tara:strand:+ start:650 stop:1372 length:723 start_codon:yes stop_codon:yes gene_type:complete
MNEKHIPFKLPKRNYSLIQNWRHLSFMHWEVDPIKLKPYIHKGLEIDTFNGKSYITTIPFLMNKVRPRLTFPIPGISSFPEFNIRTYVTYQNKPGVLFLTLDAKSKISCAYAPWAYSLPYTYAKGYVKIIKDGYEWKSKRVKKNLELIGSCHSIGELTKSEPGSLDEFLLERYCLFTFHNKKLCIAYTKHAPWTFKKAKADIIKNTLTKSYQLGISDLLNPDISHTSDGVQVYSWSIERT